MTPKLKEKNKLDFVKTFMLQRTLSRQHIEWGRGDLENYVYDNGLLSRTSTDQHSMDYGCMIASIWKAFAMLFGLALCVYHFLVSLGLARESLQFSKSLLCYLRSDPCIHTSGVILKVHNTFMWVGFSSSFLFMISLVLASSFKLPLSVLHPESWVIFTSLCHTLPMNGGGSV